MNIFSESFLYIIFTVAISIFVFDRVKTKNDRRLFFIFLMLFIIVIGLNFFHQLS
jgi:Ca2+/Na+ antiporter